MLIILMQYVHVSVKLSCVDVDWRTADKVPEKNPD